VDRARVLLIDGEQPALESCARHLWSDGHQVVAVADAQAALSELNRTPFDILFTDLRLHDGSVLELIRTVRRRWPHLPVVILSEPQAVAVAAQALEAGASACLPKPIGREELCWVARRLLASGGAGSEQARASEPGLRGETVIGRSHQMQRVLDLVEMVADSKTTVLIHGETGTGKSIIARLIHQRSPRRDRPFVEVSCGAIPETLLASELFGHVKGAFTGALTDKDGKFQAAEGGTIFLDEIACASPGLQVKLLRFLQDRQFERLGSNKTLTADVRVILATNVDLQHEVAAGRFRLDLFYRVNVVNIDLPPLRERLSDIPLLAEHFLRKYAAQCGKPGLRFSAAALAALQRYHWPGNVRELENCVERAVVLSRELVIDTCDLPPAINRAALGEAGLLLGERGQSLTLKKALEEPERRIIQAALEANDWNRQKTAAALGVNRTTLYKKMKYYGLQEPAPLPDGQVRQES